MSGHPTVDYARVMLTPGGGVDVPDLCYDYARVMLPSGGDVDVPDLRYDIKTSASSAVALRVDVHDSRYDIKTLVSSAVALRTSRLEEMFCLALWH